MRKVSKREGLEKSSKDASPPNPMKKRILSNRPPNICLYQICARRRDAVLHRHGTWIGFLTTDLREDLACTHVWGSTNCGYSIGVSVAATHVIEHVAILGALVVTPD